MSRDLGLDKKEKIELMQEGLETVVRNNYIVGGSFAVNLQAGHSLNDTMQLSGDIDIYDERMAPTYSRFKDANTLEGIPYMNSPGWESRLVDYKIGKLFNKKSIRLMYLGDIVNSNIQFIFNMRRDLQYFSGLIQMEMFVKRGRSIIEEYLAFQKLPNDANKAELLPSVRQRFLDALKVIREMLSDDKFYTYISPDERIIADEFLDEIPQINA